MIMAISSLLKGFCTSCSIAVLVWMPFLSPVCVGIEMISQFPSHERSGTNLLSKKGLTVPAPQMTSSSGSLQNTNASLTLTNQVDLPADGPSEDVLTTLRASPYWAVVLRNPFGLVPPPPTNTPPPPPPPPQKKEEPKDLGELKLSGITTLLGKRAMFVLVRGKTNICSGLVAEGERDAFIPELQVLQIDPIGGRVRVRFADVEKELNFQEHGLERPKPVTTVARAQPVPTPAPGTARVTPSPAVAVNPQQQIAQPSANTQGVVSGQLGATQPTRLPERQTVQQVGQTVYVSPGARIQTLPPSGLPGRGQSELPPEEIQRRQELQRRLIEELGIPMPPLPPLPGQAGFQGGVVPAQ